MVLLSAAAAADSDWPAYGGDPGGTRYSPLTQINPSNVATLQEAWTYRTGELGEGFKDWKQSGFEATPVLYGGTLYFTTNHTNVVALDAATGVLRWRHDSHVPGNLHFADPVSRGVSVWVDPQARPGAACRVTVYAPTLDGRLLALDGATGAPCLNFGDRGTLNLLRGISSAPGPGDDWVTYHPTSPPALLDGKLIVGSAVANSRASRVEHGDVRAFDARTGRLIWSWDPIPRSPSNPVYREWTPQSAAEAGGANAWAPLSVDEPRHLVFVPTGSAIPEYFGGGRRGDNRWANSVVALDGNTGALRWGHQLIHHDLWDYDIASQPTLADLVHDGRRVPAVIQATKTGFLFTFERESGSPLFQVVERPVPQDAVPGEWPSPTQPYPAAPPPLSRQGPLTADDAWGLTALDTSSCRRRIEAARSEGMFQPPGLRDSIMQPGIGGGANWGGLAFDPERQIAVINTMNMPFIVRLVASDQLKQTLADDAYKGYAVSSGNGMPYAMLRDMFTSELGIPCVKPPWGVLTAVDMEHGTIRWQVPLGGAPFVYTRVGAPGVGGPIVTRSGLVFVAASLDRGLRAFDTASGKMLWEVMLPAGGQATPMTYTAGGRQYLVIAAGGYTTISKRGDYLIAFALPR